MVRIVILFSDVKYFTVVGFKVSVHTNTFTTRLRISRKLFYIKNSLQYNSCADRSISEFALACAITRNLI